MKRLVVLVLPLLLAGCAHEGATQRMLSSGAYAWVAATPQQVFLDPSAPAMMVPVVARAINHVNSVVGIRLLQYRGAVPPDMPVTFERRGVIVVTVKPQAEMIYANRAVCGISLANPDLATGEIFWSLIEISEASLRPEGYLESVLCHEFGHALGLAHNKGDQDGIMWPSIDIKKPQPKSLLSDDIAILRRLYGGDHATK